MTDLSKGMIEIAGYTIDANTTSDDIKAHLNGAYEFHAATPDGHEHFRFENVNLHNNLFRIRGFFYDKKLYRLELFSHCGSHLPFTRQLIADYEWLKSVLGEPTEWRQDTIFYSLGNVQVYILCQEDEGRCGPDERIVIDYCNNFSR